MSRCRACALGAQRRTARRDAGSVTQMKRHTERRKTDANGERSHEPIGKPRGSSSPAGCRDFVPCPQFLTGSFARLPIFELRVGLDILQPLNSSRSLGLEFQLAIQSSGLSRHSTVKEHRNLLCVTRISTVLKTWDCSESGIQTAIRDRSCQASEFDSREIVRRARHGNFIESTIDFRRRERVRHLENTRRKRKRTRGMRRGRERKKLATCCCAAQATRAMNYTRRASSSCQRLLSSRVHPERAETK